MDELGKYSFGDMVAHSKVKTALTQTRDAAAVLFTFELKVILIRLVTDEASSRSTKKTWCASAIALWRNGSLIVLYQRFRSSEEVLPNLGMQFDTPYSDVSKLLDEQTLRLFAFCLVVKALFVCLSTCIWPKSSVYSLCALSCRVQDYFG